jgi:hypothetical protein
VTISFKKAQESEFEYVGNTSSAPVAEKQTNAPVAAIKYQGLKCARTTNQSSTCSSVAIIPWENFLYRSTFPSPYLIGAFFVCQFVSYYFSMAQKKRLGYQILICMICF